MSEQHKDNVIADLHEQIKGHRTTLADRDRTIAEQERENRRLVEAIRKHHDALNRQTNFEPRRDKELYAALQPDEARDG